VAGVAYRADGPRILHRERSSGHHQRHGRALLPTPAFRIGARG
jgi:hypothetical protein